MFDLILCLLLPFITAGTATGYSSATPTASLSSLTTNDDGTINGATLATLATTTTSLTSKVDININAQAQTVSYAQQCIAAMSTEELSNILEKIEGKVEGKVEEPKKVYQR